MADNCKGKGHKGLGNSSKSNLQHLLLNQVIVGTGGSPGGSSHENLELALAKYLTQKGERVESQSKGTKKKDPNTTQFCDVGR